MPLHLRHRDQYGAWRDASHQCAQLAGSVQAFAPERGRWSLLPDGAGARRRCAGRAGQAAAGSRGLFWLGAALADRLPPGSYRWRRQPASLPRSCPSRWAGRYGGYRYARYASGRVSTQRGHAWSHRPAWIRRYLAAAIASQQLARDLINTPANDMGPEELEQAARALAERHGGRIEVISGAALRRNSFRWSRWWGRAVPARPRLIDLRFARAGAPRVTLVGKGVCFDSGGLDIKASAGMALMKKDMGGAASALATAQHAARCWMSASNCAC